MEWQKLSIASVTVNGESLCETYTKRQIKKKDKLLHFVQSKDKKFEKIRLGPSNRICKRLRKMFRKRKNTGSPPAFPLKNLFKYTQIVMKQIHNTEFFRKAILWKHT